MKKVIDPCPECVLLDLKNQVHAAWIERRASRIMWHFLSKILLNKIYATSIIKASHCAIRSLTLAVCPSLSVLKDQRKLCLLGFCLSVWVSLYVRVSVCLSLLGNVSDVFCLIFLLLVDQTGVTILQ